MLEVAARSDAGVQRSINEDHYRVNKTLGLYVVCDGMGGHAGGELASRLAADAIEAFVRDTRAGLVQSLPYPLDESLAREANRLAMAFRVANRVVYDTASRNHALRGMGSTGVAAFAPQGASLGELHIAHVGDSRAYRFRDGKLRRLTRDHSYVNQLVDEGGLSQEEAARHPERNAITRALGVADDVKVSVTSDRLADGDLLLLCSDGLTDCVSERRITEAIEEARDRARGGLRLDWLAGELVRLANRAGGTDNITVLLVQRTR